MTDIATVNTAPVLAPATGPQLGLLAQLILVRDGSKDAEVARVLGRVRFGLQLGLSKADASELIDALIKCPASAKTGYVKKIPGEDGSVTYVAMSNNAPVKVSMDKFLAGVSKVVGEIGLVEYATADAAATLSAFGASVQEAMKAGNVHLGHTHQELQEELTSWKSPTQKLTKTPTEAPAFGYYEIDGQLYHWDVTGKDIAPRLRVLKLNPYATGGQKKATWRKVSWSSFQGAVQLTATFTPYGGLKSHFPEKTAKVTVPNVLVKGGAVLLSKADVAAKGKELSFCVRCGAELSDPISVANGIGPVCASYWG